MSSRCSVLCHREQFCQCRGESYIPLSLLYSNLGSTKLRNLSGYVRFLPIDTNFVAPVKYKATNSPRGGGGGGTLFFS